MNAKEMFERLGYEEQKTADGVQYKIETNENPLIISFYLDCKEVLFSLGYKTAFYLLNNKELKAIEQKRKELGWN